MESTRYFVQSMDKEGKWFIVNHDLLYNDRFKHRYSMEYDPVFERFAPKSYESCLDSITGTYKMISKDRHATCWDENTRFRIVKITRTLIEVETIVIG